jgi:hypothetical protein
MSRLPTLLDRVNNKDTEGLITRPQEERGRSDQRTRYDVLTIFIINQ